jgi:hypothetical protein
LYLLAVVVGGLLDLLDDRLQGGNPLLISAQRPDARTDVWASFRPVGINSRWWLAGWRLSVAMSGRDASMSEALPASGVGSQAGI